jgi:hypothetical protein
MAAMTQETGTAYNKTATGNVVLTTDCTLLGFYVNSTTTGTLVLKKGGSSGTAISGTITPAVGFHRFPAACPGGLHVTIANTIDVTFFVIEGVA